MLTLKREENLLSATIYVDLNFQVLGNILPADHGYGLYAALTHWNPIIHDLEGLSIQTIAGIPDKQGKIYLTERSRFRIRLPHDQVPLVYGLAGKTLTIGKHTIRLGIPQIYLLQPASKLRSRLVVIKGYQEPKIFLEAVQRQLEKLRINGIVAISTANSKPDRKTIKIKRFTVVGFGLEMSNLSDEDSLLLQEVGLGGKRRMGCGVFVPCQEGL
ncbi:CRISPR-associated protein, Cas6-related (plasmid) [Gloeothece citriformis PCC 7424]|uniref:CRISPR-associated protein, Cas6-related n=1 Tax=Gloeothece citriformis (strain PCC 7424) TaxID=65393 RepID=B7KMS1_GLOC7|nr:type I-MYXAN CRISPR-associated protein Cas6/Cmx6 [Gloeothece citriformis]ACK74093.1 CRISPR-associated protein, Cas6-related [Gloeothece citriformis PCC 7424]